MGWETIISLATAWLDPFSEGLSPASHQLLLRPAAPPYWTRMRDGLFPWNGSSMWTVLLGRPGTGMLLGATRGGDEPVFCSVITAKLK